MPSRSNQTATLDAPLTFGAIAKFPSLAAVEPAAQAIQTHVAARRVEAEAETALEAARDAVNQGGTPRARRQAQVELAARREALDAARDAAELAGIEAVTAQAAAFARVAPAIRIEYVRVLNDRALPLIRALDAVVDELMAVERVSSQFLLTAGMARARSAIVGDLGEEIRLRTRAWLDAIAALQLSR